jgi:hypothetical protein
MTHMDRFRSAYGNASESLQLHAGSQKESYNDEARVHSTLMYRSLIFAGLHGCGVATAALSFVRVLARGTSRTSPRLLSLRSTAFQIVAAVAIPSSLSIGYLIWASMASERFFERREREREWWEMQNYPEGEREEMVEIYEQQGLSTEDANVVVDIFQKDPEVFLNLMMVEELGYSRFGMPTGLEVFCRGSVPAMLSHMVCIFAPIVPLLVLSQRRDGSSQHIAIPVSEGVLVTQTLVLSFLQARLLYGAYAAVSNTIPVVAANAAWVGVLYAVSRFASKVFMTL